MKNRIKIACLIATQISLILVSFVLLQYYENHQKPFYDMINYAGKNRYLTEKVLYQTTAFTTGYLHESDPINTLTQLENNIKILRDGGVISDDTIPQLPPELTPRWDVVNESFINYKTAVEQTYDKALTKLDISQTDFDDLRLKANDLIDVSDNFVVTLTDYSISRSDFVMKLEVGLMSINIVYVILSVIMLRRIIKKESEKVQKLSKLAAVGETAARLGHDLRNPLSVIKANLEIMKLNSKNEASDQISQRRYDMINSAIWRMTHQIDDVLDFVRTRSLKLEDVSLLDTLNAVNDRIAKPKNVKINLPQNDIHITCDQKGLEVVLVNLIINAVQAIEDKGEVTIRTREDRKNSYISIEDSGPGIPHDVMPKIFEPLFTTKQIGTGLGLPSCKNIIEQHQGSINVKNNPTTFTIIIPKMQRDSFKTTLEQDSSIRIINKKISSLKESISRVSVNKTSEHCQNRDCGANANDLF